MAYSSGLRLISHTLNHPSQVWGLQSEGLGRWGVDEACEGVDNKGTIFNLYDTYKLL